MKPLVISGKGPKPVLQPEDIICIKADSRYCDVCVKDANNKQKGYKEIFTCTHLKRFEMLLRGPSFQRVSKSFIVNIKFIDEIDTGSLKLKYDMKQTIPLGRQYRTQLMRKLAVVK
jgi:DNA-binding LytR/AlgR family response regulator